MEQVPPSFAIQAVPTLPLNRPFQYYKWYFNHLCFLYEAWLKTEPLQLDSFRSNIEAYKLQVQELGHLTHDNRLYLHYYLVIQVERMEDAAAGLV